MYNSNLLLHRYPQNWKNNDSHNTVDDNLHTRFMCVCVYVPISMCICISLRLGYYASNNVSGKLDVTNTNFGFNIPIKTMANFFNIKSTFFLFLLYWLTNLWKHVWCIFCLHTFIFISQPLSFEGNNNMSTVVCILQWN